MDLRVLHYFLTVAREQSFTKASKQLHITQPTLSRQLAALEEELTEEGLLLKRRALEIIDLENKIIEEFKGNEEVIEGTITIGCGEFNAVDHIAKICKIFQEKYPRIQIALHTATADVVQEMMNKGLVEPVSTEDLDYIRIRESDHWVISMKPDDPLAKKEYITKDDLLKLPLIVPERLGVQSELANWLGADFNKIKIVFTSNFSTNAGIMALNGLGYPVSIEAAIQYWREDLLIQKRLYPEITANTVIAWRRNIPHSYAVHKFIEEINAFKA